MPAVALPRVERGVVESGPGGQGAGDRDRVAAGSAA
jgi:hypothetical protein